MKPRQPKRCQSASDGECIHPGCPQIRDGEPAKTGRSCPLYDWDHDEDSGPFTRAARGQGGAGA